MAQQPVAAQRLGVNDQLRSSSVNGHPSNPFANSNENRPSITEEMRSRVNPSGTDYGTIFDGWQSVVVQNTIYNWIFWVGLASLCMFAGLAVYTFLNREVSAIKEECFTRAAAVLIGQRNTAYLIAQDAVDKYNKLVDEFDTLARKTEQQKAELGATSAIGSAIKASAELGIEQSSAAVGKTAAAIAACPNLSGEAEESENDDGGDAEDGEDAGLGAGAARLGNLSQEQIQINALQQRLRNVRALNKRQREEIDTLKGR